MDLSAIELRLDALRNMSSSAFPSPTDVALKTARRILQAIHDKFPSYPRPKIYPTPDGGVSLEWILQRCLMDLRLSADGSQLEGEVSAKDLSQSSHFDTEIRVATNRTQAMLDWLQVAYDVDTMESASV